MPNSLDRLFRALSARYRIERELGRGGMATVYLAEDLKHHRQVAIKVLRPELAASLGAERFLREIEIAAGLEHPHILTLIDSGEADDFLYYVMPFMEGESLRDRLNRGDQLSLDEVVRILRDVVDAVAYAHRHGVVHRDIKPDNIMLADRHASVMDFGIAKALSSATDAHHMTTEGVSLGTPAYMAPEQVAADPNVDHRVDLYAIGALAYELLAGRPPFVAATPQQVLAAHVTAEPEPVAVHRHDTPPELVEVVMACLRKQPNERPAGAEDVLSVLEAPGVTTSGAAAQIPRRSSRMGTLIFWMMAATVAVAGVFAWIRTRTPAIVLDPAIVAVLPFRVSSPDPSLDYLREGMMDLLAAMMTGEGGLRAADPRTIMAAIARHADGGEITEAIARDVAADVGAGQLILGEVVSPPGQMIVTATLVSTSDGATHAEARVVGTHDELQGVLDRLTAQLLAQEAGEQQYRLSSLTTTSLAALRSYLDGQAAYRKGRYYDAVRLFDAALEEDPSFALAAVWNVFAVDWIGTPLDVDQAIQSAWAQRDRLSPKDQALLEGWAGPNYPTRGSTQDHIAAWSRALQLVPDHVEAWYALGDHYLHDGAIAGIDDWQQQAEAAFIRAVELDSTFAPALGHLVEIYAEQGDTARLRQLDRLYTQAAASSEMAPFNEWLAAWALDDSARLQRLREDIPSMHFEAAWRIAGHSLLLGQRLDDGDRAVESLRGEGSDPLARYITSLLASGYWLDRGQPNASREALDSTVVGATVYHAVTVLNAIFGDGDPIAASTAAARLAGYLARPAGTDLETQVDWMFGRCALELWRVSLDNWSFIDQAIDDLARMSRELPRYPYSGTGTVCSVVLTAMRGHYRNLPDFPDALARLDSLMLASSKMGYRTYFSLHDGAGLVRAGLHEKQGNYAAALAATRQRFNYWWFGVDYLSTYLREEGRLAAIVGDTAGAIRAYGHYLALRSKPAPIVQPEVDQVREQLAALVGR
ncbi:MAG: serine/threonine-protein kinase [Gemmatimonadales bacterium]